jgi:hypothetical protein
LRDERASEADALAHPARQLLGVGILVARQADQPQRPVDLFLLLAGAEAALDQPDLHVLLHGEPGIEGKALEDDRHAAIDVGERFAVAEDRALGRIREAGHQPQDGGLSGSRLPEERERLPFPDLEADVVENRHRNAAIGAHVRLRHVSQLDERRPGFRALLGTFGRGSGGQHVQSSLNLRSASP